MGRMVQIRCNQCGELRHEGDNMSEHGREGWMRVIKWVPYGLRKPDELVEVGLDFCENDCAARYFASDVGYILTRPQEDE